MTVNWIRVSAYSGEPEQRLTCTNLGTKPNCPGSLTGFIFMHTSKSDSDFFSAATEISVSGIRSTFIKIRVFLSV